MAKGPPKTIALHHDEYSAKYAGRTKDGRQFFLTTPFVPAIGKEAGREFIASGPTAQDISAFTGRKALGRALGETMAVTMLIGNKPIISLSPFAMGNSIASVIANEFTEATGTLYPAALIELGLVLILVTLIVNVIALLLVRTTSQEASRAA